MLGGESLHDPDQALERFVGIPAMTAPARLLAAALALGLGVGAYSGNSGITNTQAAAPMRAAAAATPMALSAGHHDLGGA